MKLCDFDVVLLEKPTAEGLSVSDVEQIGALIKKDSDVNLVEIGNPDDQNIAAIGAVSSPVWSLFSDRNGGDLFDFVQCVLANIIKEDPEHSYILRTCKSPVPIRLYIGKGGAS